MDDLEGLIDRNGLAWVIDRLAEIAGEKADHVSTNWQDLELAKEWNKAASQLYKLAANLPEGTG